MAWFSHPQVKMKVLTSTIIKSGFITFNYVFFAFFFVIPITLKPLDYLTSPRVRLFQIKKKQKTKTPQPKPSITMKIHFRNTSKDFPHRGLAGTCLLHFVPCPGALPNTVPPSARRALRQTETGMG